MNILVFNPGGNSLKVEIVSCSESQRHAAEGRKLASVGIEGIGKSARVLVFEGKKVVRAGSSDAANYTEAADPSSSANGSTGGKDDLSRLKLNRQTPGNFTIVVYISFLAR